jgi:ornithine cyclodeaminase/alanine dehydrogenase-like protein (mu-crystallin family)
VCCVRPIEQVAVYSRTPANAAAFAEEMKGRLDLPSPIRVAASAAAAADGADIICTATNASAPVLASADVAAGAHVNAVGSYTPDMQELDADLLSRARIVVDQRSAALAEAGELIAAIDAGAVSEEGLIELGDIVSGTRAGRERDDGVTVFKSVGLAVQDLCAAARALERAAAENIGLSIEM